MAKEYTRLTNLDIIDELTVGGDAAIDGDLEVTGDVSGTNADFAGDADVGGDLTVTGDVSGDNGTFTGDVSGDNAEFSGDLTLTGAVVQTGYKQVRYKQLTTVTYQSVAETGAAVSIGTIPTGAIVQKVIVAVDTGFDGTDMALDIGTGAVTGVTSAWIATSAITEATPGVYAADKLAALAAETELFAELNFTTAGTAGSARVFVAYLA